MDIKTVLSVWRHEDERVVISGDTDEAIKQMRGKQRRFYSSLIFSDFLEAGVAIVMGVLYIILARISMFAGFQIVIYAGAAVYLTMAAFLILDRVRQERGWRNRSLDEEIRHYLMRVNRRISLLRNVLWWYILPCAMASAALVVPMFIVTFDGWSAAPFFMAAVFGLTIFTAAVIFVWVYLLNQATVKNELLPRKEELERLLEDLNAE